MKFGNFQVAPDRQGKSLQPQAELLCRRALEGNERQLGPRHLNTLMSVNQLAFILAEKGELEEARSAGELDSLESLDLSFS